HWSPIEIAIAIDIGIDPCPGWHLALCVPPKTSLPSRSPLPLALLASWRLNAPAFTHPTDGIESKWTVHPARADPIR
ncbi:MAG: hypothetical protein PHF14_14395, partial [Verrucomicrobiota bacterium]|nr:hypothetical protein [Verrucomicrobiota bacterium]